MAIYKYLIGGALFSLSVAASAQSNLPPRLIVRGDDMGFAQSANEALLKSSVSGIQTSIEIMPNTPWFPQAVEMLKKHPEIDVGIHLTLTSEWHNLKWGPLTHAPSLTDGDGYFYPFLSPNKDYPGQHLKEKPWDLGEIEREFRGQIEKVLKHLPSASHLSAHMGCTSLHEDVSALAETLSKEYKLPLDLKQFGVTGIRYKGPKKTSAEKETSFLAMLHSLEPGKTYLFVDHPALDTPETRDIHHIGYTDVAEDRQGVTDTFTSPKVKEAIKQLGIRLVSYKEVVR
jgi:predicted glycoside hydrolase/deacetylase ChbG (UPF0249 family)